MKTTRRGFFGGMAGAAVAGPSLVKQAAAQALSGGGLAQSAGFASGLASKNVGYQVAGVPVSHLDYLRSRIKALRGLTADERREEIQRMGFDLDLSEVATLRSVSDRHKMAMLAERRFERQREQELSRLVRELLHWETQA